MFLRKTRFLPCWSFVSFGIWLNVWGCARDWNKSSRKGRTGKEKVADYIRTHVACIELCVTSWQSQVVSGSQSVREWVIVRRKYICQILVMWSAPNARDELKGAVVAESINYVTFLTNRCSRLINIPPFTIFVSGTSESVSYILELPWTTAIIKIWECKFYIPKQRILDNNVLN